MKDGEFMKVGKNGTMSPAEFVCALFGAICSLELFGVIDVVFHNVYYAGVASFVCMLLVMFSQKEMKIKAFDGFEVLGVAYQFLMFVLFGMLYSAVEIIPSYEIRIGLWLLTSLIYFAVAKRD